MTALHQFGAEMLKLSRGLESFAPVAPTQSTADAITNSRIENEQSNADRLDSSEHSRKAGVEWYANARIRTLIAF